MAKQTKDKKPFIFNDETINNSYGFKISTKGISLKRFKKNPVMLDSHWNNNWSVLGSWENVKVSEGLLTGEPVFDLEDKRAEEIGGKVERGFIKACSMGVLFNREDLKVIDGELVLTKCELMEVSIVAIPSNANAVRLYAADGKELLTDEEVQNLCLSAQSIEEPTTSEPKNKNVNMKIKLTTAAVAALSLSADQTEIDSEVLSAKIVELSAQKQAAELKLNQRLEADEQAKLAAVNKQVDDAVKAGQISAEKKEDFVNLGIANPDLLISTLASIPVKKSLAGAVTTPSADGDATVKTAEDFQKLSLQEQLQFKASNPEQYKQLFTLKN